MEELYNIIAELFEIEVKDIHDELTPNDVEKWDSLGQLALIAALEAHYRITFEIEEIFEIFNIGDIKKLLIKRGLAK